MSEEIKNQNEDIIENNENNENNENKGETFSSSEQYINLFRLPAKVV